jgi:4-amino-4-deoxy-L-arabinose transferase-like glycosyltransferase
LTAAALLNATPVFGAGASIMTPDIPLMLFWIGSLWMMARVIATGSDRWWLLVGLFAGLAMASKYTALFLIAGIAIWLVVLARHRLRRPMPYIAGALALALFAPVLWWNAHHGWVSFIKQGGRVSEWYPAKAGQFLVELIGGQLGLATPLIFVIYIAGIVVALKKARRNDGAAWALLASVSFLTALAILQHALGDRVQANWPEILYPAAAIAAVALSGPFWRKFRVAAVTLGFAITGFVYVQAIFAPLSLPVGRDPIARQLGGWNGLADQVEAARQATGASFVAFKNYGVASELALALPAFVKVVAIGPRWSSFDLPAARLTGETGLLVVGEPRDTSSADHAWQASSPVGISIRSSHGKSIEVYHLYRVATGPGLNAVALPRPGTGAAP